MVVILVSTAQHRILCYLLRTYRTKQVVYVPSYRPRGASTSYLLSGLRGDLNYRRDGTRILIAIRSYRYYLEGTTYLGMYLGTSRGI